VPANKLSDVERARIIELVTSAEFRDLPPSQLVPRLADIGICVASESTIHRLLKQHSLNARRGRHRPAKNCKTREHCATGPSQVWCWGSTYLRAPTRGAFFHLDLFLEVWSRKIVGWRVHDCEDNELSAKAFVEICEAEGADPKKLALHSDNGGLMKGATMVATLEPKTVTKPLQLLEVVAKGRSGTVSLTVRVGAVELVLGRGFDPEVLAGVLDVLQGRR